MTTEQSPPPAPQASGTYRDEDLVYVDPDERKVMGVVQWSNSGRPKPMQVQSAPAKDEEKSERRRRIRYYPWGTYRSMKRVFKIEGKVFDTKPQITLDEAIEKCLKEPYWN